MNWEAIGAVGEILGAIAVVVTLVYLTVQLRHNSLQMRLASSQTAAHNYSGNVIDVLMDDNKRSDFIRGLEAFPSLPADQQARFHAIMLGFHTAFATNHTLFEEGVISGPLFTSWANDWARILKCPGGAEWWAAFRGMAPEDVRTFVDQLIETSPESALIDVVPFLKRD